MRWLVNGICFSFSLFLQQQLREKNKKSPSKTCCMNSVFHLSAGGLKPEHGEKHAEDKMPRRAISFSPLAFCVHWFTFSSESIFSLTSLPGGESNYRLFVMHSAWMVELILESHLWKGLAYILFEQCLSQPDFGKMSRIQIHLTVTVVISGELMKRQLFYLLLNTKSQLDNSWWNLSKWLMHTRGCYTHAREHILAKTHPDDMLKRTHRRALMLKLFCFQSTL